MNEQNVFDQTAFAQRSWYESPNLLDGIMSDNDLAVDQFFLMNGVPYGDE